MTRSEYETADRAARKLARRLFGPVPVLDRYATQDMAAALDALRVHAGTQATRADLSDHQED